MSMGVKEDTKSLLLEKFGPATASKLESIDDSDVAVFLDSVKDVISGVVGAPIAERILAPMFEKYKS